MLHAVSGAALGHFLDKSFFYYDVIGTVITSISDLSRHFFISHN
jgi:hypothetical protein